MRDLIDVFCGCSIAVGHQMQVDKAVDLRIAYEVTLSIGDSEDPECKSELRFRLALRAARLLGNTESERRAINRDGRDFYDLASGAVHSGQISNKWDGDKGQKVVDAAADILRRALTKMILDGRRFGRI